MFIRNLHSHVVIVTGAGNLVVVVDRGEHTPGLGCSREKERRMHARVGRRPPHRTKKKPRPIRPAETSPTPLSCKLATHLRVFEPNPAAHADKNEVNRARQYMPVPGSWPADPLHVLPTRTRVNIFLSWLRP